VFKVAIVVAADRLNVQAANAFLKTLEEPPPRSILILLSSDPQRILETICRAVCVWNFAGESGPRLERGANRLAGDVQRNRGERAEKSL